ARNIPVNWNDPLEMDRGTTILPDDFEIGVIDVDPPLEFFRFAVKNYLLSGRDDVSQKGHVKPAASDRRRPETGTTRIRNHRFSEARRGSEAVRRINDGAADTSCRPSRRSRERVEAAPVLVAPWKPVEKLTDRTQACGRE